MGCTCSRSPRRDKQSVCDDAWRAATAILTQPTERGGPECALEVLEMGVCVEGVGAMCGLGVCWCWS